MTLDLPAQPDDEKSLRNDRALAEQFPAWPKIVTSLAASPVDGHEVYYVADATNGVVWHLRYRSASASSYKWEFIGGSSLHAEVTDSNTTVSTSYTDLAVAGPSVALPLAGDYDVEIGAYCFEQRNNAMSYAIGATAAVDADAILFRQASIDDEGHFARLRRKTGLTAVTLTAKYKSGDAAVSAQFADRWIKATPIRVS